MHLEPGHCYHIYNRGNNRELIFYNKENYIYFLHKIRKHLLPQLQILAWCLMPNHFHLLVQVREQASPTACGSAFRVLLSSYTRAIQKQENRTGSLFQQQTRAKNMRDGTNDYSMVCFCYIHQNPVRAGLATAAEKWPWSSYADYLELRQGTLCDKSMARLLLDLPVEAGELALLTRNLVTADKIEKLL